MFRLGDNGIVLVGNAKLIDGSVGDQPRGTQILYNIITENGIWGKQVCDKSNLCIKIYPFYNVSDLL